MKPWIKKLGGAVLVFVSVASLLFSLYCLVQVWKLKEPLTEKLQAGLTLAGDTLKTTDEGLVIVEDALTNVSTSISSLETSTVAVAQSLHDSTLVLDSFSTLFGEDLPQVITNTQSSLANAQVSAGTIDGVLYTLSSVPFIGVKYEPATSLGASLNQVSVSLGAITPSLAEIRTGLNTANANLLGLEEQVISVSQDVSLISENLEEAQDVVDQYQTQLTTARGMVRDGQKALPNTMQTAAWLLTFAILWLAISQAGMLIQGVELLMTKPTD